MPNIEPFNSSLEQINALSQLPFVKQIVFMLIVASAIALGASSVIWSTKADFTPLYMDISAQDATDIVAVLQQNNIEYEIDNRTGLIGVPTDQIQKVRLDLASEGLPRSTDRGYAILEDEQSLGTSNFLQQARYNRALEQELVSTIRQLQGVRNARVHLSIPSKSSFIRSVNKPSASVMLDLVNPLSLNDSQLSGVLHLITSSVSGMEPEHVAIVDQRGNLLSQRVGSNLNNSNENIRFTRQLEQEYSARISTILAPIVGAENVRTQVSADLDFTITETTAETYDPNNSVIRSEQTQEERLGGTIPNATVQPGTLSTVPPTLLTPEEIAENETQNETQNNGQTRINSSRNFEIDRSVSLIKKMPGSIIKLSVAVLVDLHANELPAEAGTQEDGQATPAIDNSIADQERIARIEQLVKDTIGYSEIRGDSISVINEPFLAEPEFTAVEPPPIWEQPWFFSIMKQVGAGFIVILLILVVLRPAMKNVVGTQTKSQALSLQNEMDDKVTLSTSENAELPAPSTPATSTYEENLFRAQTLVETEPARAARMIQNWLTNE